MKWMKRIRFLLGPALICLVVCILLKTVLFLGYVPSASMEPTIASGSYILGTRLFGELESINKKTGIWGTGAWGCGHLFPE